MFIAKHVFLLASCWVVMSTESQIRGGGVGAKGSSSSTQSLRLVQLLFIFFYPHDTAELLLVME